jgi:hypothetical protein
MICQQHFVPSRYRPLSTSKASFTNLVDGSFSNQNILIPNVAEKKILILVEEKKLFAIITKNQLKIN